MNTEPLGLTTQTETIPPIGFMNSYTLRLLEKFGLPMFLTILLLWNQYSLQQWFIQELAKRNDDTRSLIQQASEQTRTLNEIKDELRRQK